MLGVSIILKNRLFVANQMNNLESAKVLGHRISSHNPDLNLKLIKEYSTNEFLDELVKENQDRMLRNGLTVNYQETTRKMQHWIEAFYSRTFSFDFAKVIWFEFEKPDNIDLGHPNHNLNTDSLWWFTANEITYRPLGF